MAHIKDIVDDSFFENVDKAIHDARKDAQADVQIDYDRFVSDMLPHISGKVIDPEFTQKYAAFVGGIHVTAHVVKNGERVLTIRPVAAPLSLKVNNPDKIDSVGVFDDYSRASEVNQSVASGILMDAVESWRKPPTVDDIYKEMLDLNKILEVEGYEVADLSDFKLVVSDELLDKQDPTQEVEEEFHPNFSSNDGFDW